MSVHPGAVTKGGQGWHNLESVSAKKKKLLVSPSSLTHTTDSSRYFTIHNSGTFLQKSALEEWTDQLNCHNQ